MKNTQRHHVIPISIQGHDVPENIVYLTDQEHKELHKILNIPYQSIRLFRKRTNQIIFVNEYWVRELSTLHKLYFKKAYKLKPHLIKVQAESLENQVHKLLREHQVNDFKLREKFDTELHRLHYMLSAYHSLYLIIVLKRNRE
jgi:hypothetical protein